MVSVFLCLICLRVCSMGKNELKGRDNWQTESGGKALKAEQNLYTVFDEAFKGTPYRLIPHPDHFKNLYSLVDLPEDVESEIFTPDIDITQKEWGVSPDFAIENCDTGRIIFGEIKRQDGWVEGKDPSAGRGNAHERLCKLFTPGLLTVYRLQSGITEDSVLPFWVVFEGDITRDPKRVREIAFWFDEFQGNFFMWRPTKGGDALLSHFEEYIKPILDKERGCDPL